MKYWQKFWLYFLITYSVLHLIRDILQDLHINIFLSTILVKQAKQPVLASILWKNCNTYIIALIEIILALICLKRNRFGNAGLLTYLVALITLYVWIYYWFYL